MSLALSIDGVFALREPAHPSLPPTRRLTSTRESDCTDPSASASDERLRALVLLVLVSDHERSAEARGELEAAVRAFARVNRDRGALPEQMLIALKRATAVPRWPVVAEHLEPLHRSIVRWGVREYFRYDDPPGARTAGRPT